MKRIFQQKIIIIVKSKSIKVVSNDLETLKYENAIKLLNNTIIKEIKYKKIYKNLD